MEKRRSDVGIKGEFYVNADGELVPVPVPEPVPVAVVTAAAESLELDTPEVSDLLDLNDAEFEKLLALIEELGGDEDSLAASALLEFKRIRVKSGNPYRGKGGRFSKKDLTTGKGKKPIPTAPAPVAPPVAAPPVPVPVPAPIAETPSESTAVFDDTEKYIDTPLSVNLTGLSLDQVRAVLANRRFSHIAEIGSKLDSMIAHLPKPGNKSDAFTFWSRASSVVNKGQQAMISLGGMTASSIPKRYDAVEAFYKKFL